MANKNMYHDKIHKLRNKKQTEHLFGTILISPQQINISARLKKCDNIKDSLQK